MVLYVLRGLPGWLTVPSLGWSVPLLCKFQQFRRRRGWTLWLGVLVFFFPLSLPCGVLNCLPTDVIQPLKNSFFLARLNDSSHSQRLGVRFQAGDTAEITLAGNAAGPAQ